MRYWPWSSRPGKAKAKARAKERRGVCRNGDHYSRDCPNNKPDNNYGRIRKAARQAKMQAKDGTQASNWGMQ